MSSFTNQNKSSVTPKNQVKAGGGQKYDDDNYTYDQEFDPISGNPVFYDSVGTTPTFTNQTKSTATITNQVKS